MNYQVQKVETFYQKENKPNMRKNYLNTYPNRKVTF